MKTVGERGAAYTTPSLSALPAAVFPSKSTFKAKAKHFKLRRAEYRSNLEGCKWLHCEALKGSEEGAGNRASGEVVGEARGGGQADDSGPLMIRGV